MITLRLFRLAAILSAYFAVITIAEHIQTPKGRASGKLVTLNDRTYFFSSYDSMRWMDAVDTCNSMGMSLVSINDKGEDAAILSYIFQVGLGREYYWTSGMRIGTEWMWTGDGTPVIVANWDVDEPDEPLQLQSAIYVHSNKWSDSDIASPVGAMNYICEERGTAV